MPDVMLNIPHDSFLNPHQPSDDVGVAYEKTEAQRY